MKAKDICLQEGSGCYFCQEPFNAEDEICFDSGFMNPARIMHVKCAKKNGKILGMQKTNEKYLEGVKVDGETK